MLVKYKGTLQKVWVQHAAMVPASVAMASVPRHSEYVKTCMFEGLEYNLWEHILPCLVDYGYAVMQHARHYLQREGGSTQHLHLPVWHLLRAAA